MSLLLKRLRIIKIRLRMRKKLKRKLKMKKKSSGKLLILLLLIGLIVFTQGCRTIPETDDESLIIPYQLPEPEPEKRVYFEDTGKGFFLSYDDYRALEENIINQRGYVKILQEAVSYYEEGIYGKRERTDDSAGM